MITIKAGECPFIKFQPVSNVMTRKHYIDKCPQTLLSPRNFLLNKGIKNHKSHQEKWHMENSVDHHITNNALGSSLWWRYCLLSIM